MLCPECRQEGEKSRIEILGSSQTLLTTHNYYDEEGRLHHHDPNGVQTEYKCSRGHRWAITDYPTCSVGGCGVPKVGVQ